MADNGEHLDESNAPDVEKKVERLSSSRVREQRTGKTKDKFGDHLPTPPPDPWTTPSYLQGVQNQDMTRPRSLEEEEDIIAYLTDLGTPPFESQTSECPSRNSATSTMAVASLCTEEAFEHLDRLYALTEQILELRNRSSRFFKRVRDLERLKVLRNADRKLENAFARDKDAVASFHEEDTGFAESLLDAMLSNCREPQFQRRNIRSPSSRQRSLSLALSEQSLPRLSNPVNRFDIEKQLARNESSTGAPKVSKWTRVKAAFKWERACTNDIAESLDATTPSTPTTKYLRIPETGNWSGSNLSSCTSEISGPPTPFGRVSSASSSNEGSYDGPRKNITNPPDRQSVKAKEDKKKESSSQRSRSLDGDVIMTDTVDDAEHTSETNQGKPRIRITSDNDRTMSSSNSMEKKETETSKRPNPTLTITIPSNEEEIRSVSSPESISPLLSSTQNSGGNSPQHAKTRQDASREFKRQRSALEEPVTPVTKVQRQDSKWNKVRRAFLTNSAFSVPPSPIRIVSGQSFLPDGSETPKARSCSGSVEDLEKTTATNSQAETRRDYQALREKLGAEFHRKLVEWERLKNMSPRATTKTRESLSYGATNPREGLLPEERLAPEFKKKLQDWKRAKKGRRGSGTFEQQRVSRRRLTDWQLWRSPLKPETRNQDTIGSRASCGSGGSAGSIVSDGRSNLCEDFVRRMEAWRRMNETGYRNADTSKEFNSNRLGVASGIDESEFVALEKVLLISGDRIGKERRESNARQLDECFDGETRFVDGAQSANCGNEVLIRTSVGSYRFEGISREFTRKLYDWEKYRGISPRSSTFRLLGPAYAPFTGDEVNETSTDTAATTKVGDEERIYFVSLKRSKSVGSVMEGTLRKEGFIRRSTSLQSLDYLRNRLEDTDRGDTSPAPTDAQRTEGPSEDTVMDDSEPEAMIVDIEDVIEETASPLKRVQPHQTPVYSVAASETTSIAVPLGTVTSSHEPSPVFLVEVEDRSNRKQWESRTRNLRKNVSSGESSSSEHFEGRQVCSKRNDSCEEDRNLDHWRLPELWSEKEYCVRNNFEQCKLERLKREDSTNQDKDSVKSDRSVCSTEWCEGNEESTGDIRNRCYDRSDREEVPAVSSDGESEKERGREFVGKDENKTMERIMKYRSQSALSKDIEESMDLSSEMKHECVYEDQKDEEVGSSEDEEDTLQDETKIDNEYEEITPGIAVSYSSTLSDNRSRTDYQDTTKTSLKSAINCESDNKPGLNISTSKAEGSKTDENYGIIREETQTQYHELTDIKSDLKQSTASRAESLNSKQDNNCIKESSMLSNPTDKLEKHERREYRSFSSVPSSFTTTSSSSLDYHREPTVRTTSLTVTSCRDERCFERIIINEKTLNKIVVPTASTGDAVKTLKQSIVSKTKDLLGERNNQSDASAGRETNNKKNDSPTRNVFVKTKRMIFSPFRRVEDRLTWRKESDASEDDRSLRPKSKSKSRSASPKVSRQDALLRMPLSLSWPLRPCSKDRDVKKETKIDERAKKEVTVVEEGFKKFENFERKINTNIESVSNKSNEFEEVLVRREGQGINDGKSLMESTKENRFRNSLGQREHRVNVSVQVTPNEQNRTSVAICSSSLKRRENEGEVSFKSDSLSSDLIHKLNILSSVAARRDGRTNTISVDSSLESHSSRIRRAKENFLSRRGGPLCHSVVEPQASGCSSLDFIKRSANYYDQIMEEEGKNVGKGEKISGRNISGDGIKEDPETKDERGRDLSTNEKEVKDSNSEASRSDLVKSASAGMINIDPNTFERLAETNRGCESLPRTISKRRELSGPFAKIVNKFKLSRLIRGRDSVESNMSTISRLCRQSLLIDVRSGLEERQESESQNTRDEVRKSGSIDKVWDTKK